MHCRDVEDDVVAPEESAHGAVELANAGCGDIAVKQRCPVLRASAIEIKHRLQIL